jgi:DNA-binding CsgD family transcriptional regulator
MILFLENEKGVPMASIEETLDGISRGGEAVFATDGADRIVHWNKACEALLGRSARSVMGKPCYEVLGGRDSFGNQYCQRSCPVARQAREKKDDPVHAFPLSVQNGTGARQEVSSSIFSIPSYHPALAKLVHVLRTPRGTVPPAPPAASAVRDPAAPVVNDLGEAVSLSRREKQILSCLSRGLSTIATAKKLFIAPVTVRNHIQSVLRKLDLHSKVAAVAFAYRHQMI